MPDFIKLNEVVVNTEKLKAKYKGTNKEEIMNSIFSHFDAMDTLDPSADPLNSYLKLSTQEQSVLQDGKIDTSTWEFAEYTKETDQGFVNPQVIKEQLQNKFSIEDIEQALNDINSATEDITPNNTPKTNTNDLPEIIRNTLASFGQDATSVEISEKNGEKIYKVTSEENERYFTEYHAKSGTTLYGWGEILSEYGVGTEVEIQNKNNSYTSFQYDTGIVEILDEQNSKRYIKLENTIFDMDDGNLPQTITINKNMLNETNFDVQKDENGQIKDITVSTSKLNQNQPQLEQQTQFNATMQISNKEKQTLINLLNNGAMFGKDFDIITNGNKIEITPFILDANNKRVTNIPQKVKVKGIELLQQGFRTDKDYNITQNENGSFNLNYNSQKAMEYTADEKIVTYSSDENQEQSLILKGNEITSTTKNNLGLNNTVTYSRTELLLSKLLQGDFKQATLILDDISSERQDFKLYEVALEYQEKTGKNLLVEYLNLYKQGKIDKKSVMQIIGRDLKALQDLSGTVYMLNYFNSMVEYARITRDFSPYETQVKDLLPKISEKKYISENKYTQTINNKTYTVELKDNILTVTKDGKLRTFDFGDLHPNKQKQFSNISPIALYRLASGQITLTTAEANESEKGLYGDFDPITKQIRIFLEHSSGNKQNETIIHEIGHTYYDNTFIKNKVLEKSFAEELEQNKDAINSLSHMYKLVYCTKNVNEFVAEAYTLLTTGDSQSAYTICNYFPKTLAIVKEMIENADL